MKTTAWHRITLAAAGVVALASGASAWAGHWLKAM